MMVNYLRNFTQPEAGPSAPPPAPAFWQCLPAGGWLPGRAAKSGKVRRRRGRSNREGRNGDGMVMEVEVWVVVMVVVVVGVRIVSIRPLAEPVDRRVASAEEWGRQTNVLVADIGPTTVAMRHCKIPPPQASGPTGCSVWKRGETKLNVGKPCSQYRNFRSALKKILMNVYAFQI